MRRLRLMYPRNPVFLTGQASRLYSVHLISQLLDLRAREGEVIGRPCFPDFDPSCGDSGDCKVAINDVPTLIEHTLVGPHNQNPQLLDTLEVFERAVFDGFPDHGRRFRIDVPVLWLQGSRQQRDRRASKLRSDLLDRLPSLIASEQPVHFDEVTVFPLGVDWEHRIFVTVSADADEEEARTRIRSKVEKARRRQTPGLRQELLLEIFNVVQSDRAIRAVLQNESVAPFEAVWVADTATAFAFVEKVWAV